jgi:predicted flap endonuclease-1-like 5' DNA nuclease
MTMLGVQLFLLLLAAFLAGAIIACFLRRTFFARATERAPLNEAGTAGQSSTGAAVTSAAATGSQSTTTAQAPATEMMPAGSADAGASRFGRALTEAPQGYSGSGQTEPAPKPEAVRDAGPATVTTPPAPEPEAPTVDAQNVGSAVTAAATAAVAAAVAVQQTTNGAGNGAATASHDASTPTAPPSIAAQAPEAQSPADDLTLIRGIDDELASRLSGLGVRRFSDIAAWGSHDIARISQSLGLTGRVKRESWIEQAQILAKGGSTDYQRNRDGSPRRFIWDDDLGAQSIQPIDASATEAAPVSTASSEDSVTVNRPLTGMAALIAAAAAAEAASADQSASSMTSMAQSVPSPSSVTHSGSSTSEAAGLVSVRSEALIGTDAASLAKAARGDDLKRIRGIGVLIETRLNAMGIRSYDQIANWSREDVASISQTLDFKGRIERENWIEQARILASGGETDFSRRVYRDS